MKRFVFSICAVFLCALPAYALTIDEAIELARANNHRVKQYRHLTEAQENRVGSEAAAFWPSVDLDYTAVRSDEALVFGNPIIFQKQTQSTATATASYNLFSGLSDWHDVKSAQALLQASRYELQGVEADIVLEAKNTFIEVLRAQQNVLVAREAVTLLQSQRRNAELQYRVGLTAKNELLKVEVELASAQQERIRTEGLLRVAKRALERAIGVTMSDDASLEELGEIEKTAIDIDQLADIMYDKRSELAYLTSRKKSREYTRRSILGGYLPSIDLSVSYSQFGERLATDGRIDTLPDEETQTLITATWNLFGGLKTARDAAAERAEILALEERVLDTKQDLLLQLRQAVEVHTVSAERIRVSKTAVAQAEENYRITENQFKQRVADATKLLEARILLTRSRSEYISSIYNHHRSIAAIERVIESKLENIKSKSGGPSGTEPERKAEQ